ncbi:MAG: cell division protein FtsA [Candidatus Eisenbacteria bacterium]|uniref:Cell division protein FtsA n=1 Tax=Eiseniibacteriota bacterium TaxID=2212470 RepID=A0A937X9L5_UNCEI|nr:cell division protein FtsA [Candidatus Eisenbacteria bacterium]
MPSAQIATGLDVGSTKVVALIAEVTEHGELRVLGIGESPSSGLRQGNLVHLEATAEAVRTALARAEKMADLSVRDVTVGIAGDHLRSINSRGVIAVSGRDNEVTPDDLRRVVEAARALAIPSSRAVLHVIPQEFLVDDQSGIKDPVGMAGVRLEAEVHIITASATAVRNLERSIEKAGYRAAQVIAVPLASAWAVLEEDERRLGVILLDVGAGTTDLAVYFDGSVHHTAVISMGGAQITNDIAIGLRTPLEAAERIKIEYGCALSSLVERDAALEIPGVGGRAPRAIRLNVLAAIIEPRVEEILTQARTEVGRLQGHDFLAAGIVVTGGTAGLRGMVEAAERVFEMPARAGLPRGVSGLAQAAHDPRYATALGLAMAAAPRRRRFAGETAGVPQGSRLREWLRARVPFLG